MRRARAALALALLLGAAPASRLTTQPPADSVIERRTREISAKLRCPVCQGESILDSPARLSAEMRDLVREQLRAGRSEDEVLGYFEAKYGEWILLEPRLRGANYAVYLIPFLVIAAGFAVVAFAVRRWTAPDATEGAGGSPADRG
jgi:cytochrome c-type biogenesis protein CcmH